VEIIAEHLSCNRPGWRISDLGKTSKSFIIMLNHLMLVSMLFELMNVPLMPSQPVVDPDSDDSLFQPTSSLGLNG
jgi:hypothetical protein